MPEPECGCKCIIGDPLVSSVRIERCPLHASAKKLLEAAKEALNELPRYDGYEGPVNKIWEKLKQAITEAEKKP